MKYRCLPGEKRLRGARVVLLLWNHGGRRGVHGKTLREERRWESRATQIPANGISRFLSSLPMSLLQWTSGADPAAAMLHTKGMGCPQPALVPPLISLSLGVIPVQKWTRTYALLALAMLAILAVSFFYTYRGVDRMVNNAAEVETIQSKYLAASEIGNGLNRMAAVVEGIGSFVLAAGDSTAVLQPYLADLQRANPYFSGVFFARPDGRFLMSYDWEQPAGYDPRQRDWYQRALDRGGVVFADFYDDAAGHGRITSVVMPVYDGGGQLLGVAGADLPLAYLEREVHAHLPHQESIHFVVDTAGNVLQLCGAWAVTEPWWPQLTSTMGPIVLENPQALLEPLHVELDAGGGILAVHEVPHSQWYVVSYLPYDRVPVAGMQVFPLFAVLAAAVLLLFGLLYGIQYRWFVNPLAQLDRDIGRINVDGDLGYRVRQVPGSVTAQLRTTVNVLLDRLQEALESLQADEEELRAANDELESAFTQLHAAEQDLRQHYEELVASQEQLATSEAYNRAIVDLIPDLMIRFDHTGCILDFPSSAGWELLVPAQEAAGRPLEEILPPDLAGEFKDKIAQALERDEIIDFEYGLRLPSGPQGYYECRLLPAGSYVLALVRDITVVKEAQQVEEEWQRLLQYIIHHDPNAIAVLDKDLKHVFVSERFCQDYNVEDQDVIGRGHYEVFPEIPPEWRQVHQRALAGEVLSGEEEEFQRADGTVDYTRWECRPWYERDGSIGGIVLYTEVITRQRRAEQALKASEHYRQSILHLIPDIIIHYDSQGTYLEIMASAATMLYRSKDEVLGRTVHEILPPAVAAATSSAIADCLRSGVMQTLEYQLHVNGEPNWYESRMLPIQEGEVVALIRDITERKLAEEELTHLTYYDVLTNLRNRRYVERIMDEWETDEEAVGIMLLDVNGLKIVNDSLGHEAGDDMLRRTVAVVKEGVRSQDLVGRWGGDEFVVLLPGVDAQDLETISQRILDLAEADAEANGPVPLSMAVGWAMRTRPNQDLRSVLKEAEDEMYRHKSRNSQSSRSTLVRSLQRALEAKSFETQEHCNELESWAVRLAHRLRLSERDVDEISLLAVLHDLGKVGIAEDILTKRGPLNDEEWAVIKKHPEIGHRIAMASPDLVMVAEGILSHHERWDGQGYPRGLSGEAIPLSARIVAIADAFEAMVSDRPYRKALDVETALQEIADCAGTQFDPQLAVVFVRMVREHLQCDNAES